MERGLGVLMLLAGSTLLLDRQPGERRTVECGMAFLLLLTGAGLLLEGWETGAP